MATAKKLPSGSYRVRVYSHTEKVKQQDGSYKDVKRYESFTADTKKEAEFLAAEFKLKQKRMQKPSLHTLGEAMDLYISESSGRLSPTTISFYNKIRNNHFSDIINLPLKKLTNDLIQSAVDKEYQRGSQKRTVNKKPLSVKTVSNAYGLLSATVRRYAPELRLDITLATPKKKLKELPAAADIIAAVRGSDIELPVLLAMWLSFSLSEIRGITKSKSISNGYVTIHNVVVDVNNIPYEKEGPKAYERTRRHKIPPYIQKLIYATESDQLVTMSGRAIYYRLDRLLKKNGLPHITFHDLRHVNASVMALLRIPDKYAMERGGWKTDTVMKNIYQHTFTEEREAADAVVDSYFENALKNDV